jgi:hypothetical protein
MGFLKNESLQVIVDAPRDSSNSFNFTPTTTQSMPIKESGLLVKFFIAAKFNHTIPSGWPVIQIRRTHANNSNDFSQVFSTTMEPRPNGYLNVFEYDVQNMAFDIQYDDIIRVFWPLDSNNLRRYSLAYFRDGSNVMLSIEIDKNDSITLAVDDSISTHPSTPVDINDFTTNSVSLYDTMGTDGPETSKKAQTQVAIIIGGVLCAMAAIILVVVLAIITVFVVIRCRNHTKDFSPNTNDLKTSAPVVDNPTYSLVDGEFRYEFIVMIIMVSIVHITIM